MSEKYINYPLDKIQALPALEAIRKRPTMYAGPLDDPTLPARLILDGCCAALESAKKGEVSEISILITSDTRAIISDNGPGWSREIREPLAGGNALRLVPVPGTPWPVLMMTMLYACKDAKEEDTEDLCQMGITVVNALSAFAGVTIYDGDEGHHYGFERGNYTGQFSKKSHGILKGTEVHFDLDPTILGEDAKIDVAVLERAAEKYACAYGCTITVEDMRNNE